MSDSSINSENRDEPKVLFVYLSGSYGDDEQLALEDIFELNAQGLNWRALCLNGTTLHQRFLTFGKSKTVTVDAVPNFFLDRDFRDVLYKEIENGVNLIHVYGSEHLGSILPWMLKYPRVSVVVSEGPNVEKNIRHFFQSFFYSRIDSFLVPSSAIKRRIQAMRSSLGGKVRVVHPGLDFNIFNPEHFDFTLLRQKWQIDPNTYLVGMIAGREYVKAQAAFIKAAASFLRNEELARRTKFVIIGFESEGNKNLIDLIDQFHLQDQILLVPEEESIPKVLGTLDVYVLPSSKAMFGIQAIESLAMGTPIICASSLDSLEWIGNSQGGLLMRSGDSFDLQRKLRMMLEDPEELKVMGERAVQYAREQYDRRTRTDRLLQIYERSLRRRALRVKSAKKTTEKV
ncbi:MAG: glycosyltransferase family 4 protein [Bdellovibrionales bacterium]|nr:glycosyltransferase family 4 protein [Bdellovibrionales bacterium]